MTVFANGLEVSAKKQGCKVIAAFPDTCFTPPQTPATPPGVPIPYPNFATDSDLASGTSTVKVKGGEVSQENSSKFSKVSGDEAGSAPKKGLITSKNGGASYAIKWSMDVKAEGKGLVRFSDMATTNHASNTGNDAPWIIAAQAALGRDLTAAEKQCPKIGEHRLKCGSGSESHHIVPDMCYRTGSRRSNSGRIPNAPALSKRTRPPARTGGMAICLTSAQHSGLHSSLNSALKLLGDVAQIFPGQTNMSVPGTAPMEEIFDKCVDSINSIQGLAPDCKDLAIEMAATQASQTFGQPGRTTTTLPDSSATTVMLRGYY
jgi:hypothetical protein